MGLVEVLSVNDIVLGDINNKTPASTKNLIFVDTRV